MRAKGTGLRGAGHARPVRMSFACCINSTSAQGRPHEQHIRPIEPFRPELSRLSRECVCPGASPPATWQDAERGLGTALVGRVVVEAERAGLPARLRVLRAAARAPSRAPRVRIDRARRRSGDTSAPIGAGASVARRAPVLPIRAEPSAAVLVGLTEQASALVGQIERRVPIEEVERAQLEAVPHHRHHRPVLGAHHVVHADGVPEHDVGLRRSNGSAFVHVGRP